MTERKVIEDIFETARQTARAHETSERNTEGEAIGLVIDAVERLVIDLNRIANSLETISGIFSNWPVDRPE